MSPQNLALASRAFRAPWNACIVVSIHPETYVCRTRAFVWSSGQHPVSASSVDLALVPAPANAAQPVQPGPSAHPGLPAPPALVGPAALPAPARLDPHPPTNLKRVWIPAAVLVAACAPALIVYSRRLPQPSSAVDGTKEVAGSGLALTVTQSSERLILLRWNRSSPLVAKAQSALLSVIEAGNRRDLDIDLSLLKTGSIAYSSTSNDVEFRLNVLGSDWRVVSECVRMLGGTLAAPTVLSLNAVPPKQALTPNSAQQALHPANPLTPVRRFQAPPAKPSVKPQPGGAAVLEPPPVLVADATAHLPKQTVLRDPRVPAWTEPQKPAASQPQAAPSRLPEVLRRTPAAPPAVQPTFVPPTATRKVLPQHPANSRLFPTDSVEVSIEASVDASGNVTRVKPTPDAAKIPADFVRAALAAARQWRFSPATLGNKAVPAEHIITFRFIRPKAGE